jgi:hypothetical protein
MQARISYSIELAADDYALPQFGIGGAYSGYAGLRVAETLLADVSGTAVQNTGYQKHELSSMI